MRRTRVVRSRGEVRRAAPSHRLAVIQLEDRLMPGSMLGLPLDGWNQAPAAREIALTSKLPAGAATPRERQPRPTPQAAPTGFAAEVAARSGQAGYGKPEQAADPARGVHRDLIGLGRGVLDEGLPEGIDGLNPVSPPRRQLGNGAAGSGEATPGAGSGGTGVMPPRSGEGPAAPTLPRSAQSPDVGQDGYPWNLRQGSESPPAGLRTPALAGAPGIPDFRAVASPGGRADYSSASSGDGRQTGELMPETNVPPDAPPDNDNPCRIGGGNPGRNAPGAAAIPNDLPYSVAPVRYFDGTVKLSTTDLSSSAFGAGCGQTRSWTNTAGYTGTAIYGGSSPGGQNGSGWVVTQLPFVLTNNDFASAVIVTSGSSALFFDDVNGSNPTPHFFIQDKLSHPNGEFVWTTTTGDQYHFYDFTGAPSFNRWGKFKGMTDADGNVTAVTAWTSDGRQAEVQRSTPTGQSPRITESYLYSYVPSGDNAGLVAGITLRRQVNGGAWGTVRQVNYDYYTNADTFGNAGDLKTAVIQDGAGNTLDTKYYRYYKDSSGTGYQDGLRFLFEPQSFARLQAHLVGTGYTPFTAPDSMVAGYADNYFEYDYSRRVSKEVAQGNGCSVCTGGQGTFAFSYSTGNNAPGYNSWQYKTVEVLPDNSDTFVSQNIVYANSYGEVMLKVYESGAPGNTQKWATFYKYDDQGRIVLTANPSAVSGYDDTKADLLNNVGGHYQYLRDHQGKIDLTDYYTATTATATTPGGASGYVKDTKVQQGQLGTPILLSGTQYYAHTGGATVDVTVLGPGGVSAVAPADQFTYVAPPPPTVTGLSPSSGSTAGGTSVTITGSNFTNASAVTFGTTSASFTVASSTTIQVTTPAHTAGTVDVTVATPGGTAATQFTYVAPTVTGLSPTSGSIAGGYPVTITGTNFSNATVVRFDGSAAYFYVVSDTSIQATAPAHAAGVVDVTVGNAGDTSAVNAADRFTYVVPPPPAVTGLSPTSGSVAGGYTVTISGTNFSNASAVNFDGSAASFYVVSDTSIQATAPAHAAGVVDVTVTTPGGTSAVGNADQFTYFVPPPPAVTGLSPNSGSSAGSYTVTITGMNFSNASAVNFDGSAASFYVVSDTSIQATAPAHAAGVVDVTVTTPGGTSATNAADRFTYVAPTVTGLSPTSGSTAGGTAVTITGTNFSNASVVNFDGSAAYFYVVSDTSIQATAPAHAAGVVDVTVGNAGDTSAVNAADRFTYVVPPPPAVTGLSPTSGSVAGVYFVSITGTNFTGASAVNFDGNSAFFYVVSDTSIQAMAPAHAAGVVDVTVTTPGGTSAVGNADQFTYVTPDAPTVTGLSPGSGSTSGGFVTISGTNFTDAGAVNFGTTAAFFTVVSATTIQAYVPAAEAAGVVDVTVTTPGGTSATNPADQYTYLAVNLPAPVTKRRHANPPPPPSGPPVVTGVSPNTGSTVGGYTVTISGSNFTGASQVLFGVSPATSFSVLSDTMIQATAPAYPVDTVYPIASYVQYRNPDGTGAETTSYGYTWFANSSRIQSTTVQAPVIAPSQNGPANGAPDVQTTVFDVYGRPVWARNSINPDPANPVADGYISYWEYDQATGAVVKSIRDVDTTRTSDFLNLPAGWVTPAGGGLHLRTATEVDSLGRPTKVVRPNGDVTYVVYNDPNHESRTYAGWNAVTNQPTGPTVVKREDRGHDPSYVETFTMSAAPHVTNGRPDGTEAVAGVQSLSRTFTSPGGQVSEDDSYFDLTGQSYSTAPYLGTAGTNFYVTLYAYDHAGRLYRIFWPTGTITQTDFDGLGRAVDTMAGTSTTNMVTLSQYVYDQAAPGVAGGIGDGNLTEMVLLPGGGAAARRVDYFYDWRDRAVAAKEGVQVAEDTATHRPITYTQYDNLNEAVASELYDGDGITVTIGGDGVPVRPDASRLRARIVNAYDDQGRVFRTDRYSVDQTNGTVSANSLRVNYWYDHRGNTIKVARPGGLVTKTAYDGADRPTAVYTTDDVASTWEDAGTVANNTVLSQTETTYDADNNTILTVVRDRFHDATALGDLAATASARVSYSAYYYDLANRSTDQVDVGTNGGTPYSRPAQPPADSDTVLVTHTDYDAAGRVYQTTDPRGLATRKTYDMLGRTVKVVEAYQGDGTPTDTANRTTAYTYDGAGHVLTRTAVLPNNVTEATRYTYGVTTATGSDLNSDDLLASVTYPDNGRPNAESYTYNAQGDMKTKTDRDGTSHAYSYDVLDRQTADAVTGFGAGVDQSILRIETGYDTGGRASLFTSYTAPGNSGSIVNQVQRVYDGLSQLVAEYQSHAGPVNGSTPAVRYAYSFNPAAGGANTDRATGMTYPNGRTLTYTYAAGIDDRISRLTSVVDGSTTLEAYTYLGLNTVVKRAHPESGVDLSYIKQPGEPTGDAGDQYTGLDRFGRVVDQRWVHTADGSATDRFRYGYDRGGNRLYRDNLVNAAFGELYHANGSGNGYNNFNDVTAFSRGTLNASKDTIASPTHTQQWTLDALGDWTSFANDGVTQTRSHNSQNQITALSTGTTPGYDNNGNTTTDDQGTVFVYDAWNRLVRATNQGGTAVAYGYDGLNRRVTVSVNGGQATDLYYSDAWQVVEEQTGGAMQAQYVWSPVYVDALVERDAAGGPRLYVQQDANWDVTAVVDTGGVVRERYVYDPYGKATVLDPNTWQARSVSQYGWAYLHQGGRYDSNTGLYYYRNRDLSPTLGRWMEEDPVGYADGMNLYEYERSRPTGNVDPEGTIVPFIVIGVIAIGVVLLTPSVANPPPPPPPPPPPKPRTPDVCCRDAMAAGLDRGDTGGVVCCDGRKITCDWTPPAKDKAEEIIKGCIRKHEDVHHNHIDDCPKKCPSLTRPPFKKGVDPKKGECEAYTAEFACYADGLKECDKLDTAAKKKACKDRVQKEWDTYKKLANKNYGCGFK